MIFQGGKKEGVKNKNEQGLSEILAAIWRVDQNVPLFESANLLYDKLTGDRYRGRSDWYFAEQQPPAGKMNAIVLFSFITAPPAVVFHARVAYDKDRECEIANLSSRKLNSYNTHTSELTLRHYATV